MTGPGFFLVGLDLGRKGDPTAIAVVEQWIEPLGGVSYVTYEPLTKRRLDVRHLMRVPLGTPYPGRSGGDLRFGEDSGVAQELPAGGG